MIALTLMLALNTDVEADEDEQSIYEGYCEEIAEMYGICPELLEAMCEQESHWDEKAFNGSCKGLMQINVNYMTDRMSDLGVNDATDPYSNILLGADYINELAEKYGDPLEVLMVYNMGNRGSELYEDGIYSQYAQDILDRAWELELEHGK